MQMPDRSKDFLFPPGEAVPPTWLSPTWLPQGPSCPLAGALEEEPSDKGGVVFPWPVTAVYGLKVFCFGND